jgi:hypothetical protein
LDELYELLNSDSTHRHLIDRPAKAPQTTFITRCERVAVPNEKEEILMKCKGTFVFAGSIIMLSIFRAVISRKGSPPEHPGLDATSSGQHSPLSLFLLFGLEAQRR